MTAVKAELETAVATHGQNRQAVSPAVGHTLSNALGNRFGNALGSTLGQQAGVVDDSAALRDVPVRLLPIPHELPSAELPSGVRQDATEGAEIIVLTERNAAQLIQNRIAAPDAAVIPVINVSAGDRGDLNCHRADIQSKANRFAISDAITLLHPVVERTRRLAPQVRFSSDARVNLLARLAVRDRGLVPRRDPARKETIAYPDEAAIPNVLDCAEDLVRLGLLRRQFYDNLIVCPRCESARLCAREQCSYCNSSHLVEEPILHHLRCAHQALEHEFRRGTGLYCPKCLQALEHFSVDYDRPGTMLTCRACGRSSGEAAVAFLCLDCGIETRAGDTGTRIIHSYDITPAGHACTINGTIAGNPGTVMCAADRVDEFAERQAALGNAFCVLSIEIAPPKGAAATRGYEQTLSLFAALLHETFNTQTEIVEEAPFFFVLLAEEKKREVEAALPEIKHRLERFLTWPHEIRYAVYGTE